MVAVCPICDIAECAHIREPKLKARISDLERQLADNQTVIDASDDLTAAYLAGYGAAQKRIGKLEEALRKIANGEGAYGAQAHEYKQIARAALKGR